MTNGEWALLIFQIKKGINMNTMNWSVKSDLVKATVNLKSREWKWVFDVNILIKVKCSNVPTRVICQSASYEKE